MRNIPKLSNSNLILQNQKAVLQTIDDNNIKIVEYKIPIISNKNEEIAIKIDDFIIDCFNTFRYASFDRKIINFENQVQYEYEEGDIMELEIPDGSILGVLVIPDEKVIDLIESGISIRISLFKKYLILDDDCGKIFKFKTTFISNQETVQEQTFNSKDIIEVLKNNSNKMCKVHILQDFPICFEFDDHRIFISPLDD